MTDKAVTQTWLLLIAITVGSWWLAPAQYSETLRPSVPITALVLALTLVKSRLIIRQFMEVRTAPRWLKLATDGWLAVLFVSILTIYLI
ncbi:prokaryotic cytochrome C oxidase subunit IV family protein [Mycolicibacterium sp. (ex Dasyatis americana)]|uniref:cytochrome C oxidase subunit IV family protein n=1 Tax=Mycobacterium sp. DBP42 TaxID=2545267 RepID=UPI0008725629|nr:cytochrome C oxidase subunit IV family protein [Mycobacterium sp. DBP42]OFB36603.1 prokaryotic cytochrome C oxidase subunit IV family protein [Mycolicibacterium sp. (ex Dasyatis americana)]TMS51267.1 prokaryotic cytochrome C oxidase subunit IV family protein [Mycobacterium sp. DBP42]